MITNHCTDPYARPAAAGWNVLATAASDGTVTYSVDDEDIGAGQANFRISRFWIVNYVGGSDCSLWRTIRRHPPISMDCRRLVPIRVEENAYGMLMGGRCT